MKKHNDSIQFESRAEIEDIMLTLTEWKREHKGNHRNELVQELIDHLEVMYWSW